MGALRRAQPPSPWPGAHSPHEPGNLTGVYVEVLGVQTVFPQDLGAAATWRSPQVAQSSQRTRPGLCVRPGTGHKQCFVKSFLRKLRCIQLC